MGSHQIPNFNQVELAFLVEFMEGTLELAGEIAGSVPEEPMIRKRMAEFQTLLESAFPDETCARIIQIEDFRNDLLEIILDRLDDTLNLYVDSADEDLKSVGLSSFDAIRRIPEYRAALEILGELSDGEPDFYSRGKTAGHVWNEEHIRMLINRFESGEYDNSVEILGIAERLNELLAVDHRQEMMIQQCGAGESMEELRAIRCKLFESAQSLYRLIYEESLLAKPRKELCGVDLIISILKSDQQRAEDQLFSSNDLSHSEFCALAETHLPDDIDVRVFREELEQFHGQEQWKLFEQNEQILYRITELFIRDLTIHLLCMEPAQNHPLREKIEKSVHFVNASQLTAFLGESGVKIGCGFVHGGSICSENFSNLATALKNPDLRELLMALRLRPLAEEIVETEWKSRELSAVAVRRNRGLSLDQFRQIRADLTDRLNGAI